MRSRPSSAAVRPSSVVRRDLHETAKSRGGPARRHLQRFGCFICDPDFPVGGPQSQPVEKEKPPCVFREVPPFVVARLDAFREEGRWTVLVERCHDCEGHQVTTRHKPQEYSRACEAIVFAAARELRVDVKLIEFPTPDLRSRMGAFEVFLLSPSAHILAQARPDFYVVHSKLLTRRWPTIEILLWKFRSVLPLLDCGWRSALHPMKARDEEQAAEAFRERKLLQQRCLSDLGRVCNGIRSLDELASALDHCHKLGADVTDPNRYKEGLDLYAKLQRLVAELDSALRSGDIVAVQLSLHAAEKAKLQDRSVTIAAGALLKLEEECRHGFARKNVDRIETALHAWNIPKDWIASAELTSVASARDFLSNIAPILLRCRRACVALESEDTLDGLSSKPHLALKTLVEGRKSFAVSNVRLSSDETAKWNSLCSRVSSIAAVSRNSIASAVGNQWQKRASTRSLARATDCLRGALSGPLELYALEDALVETSCSSSILRRTLSNFETTSSKTEDAEEGWHLAERIRLYVTDLRQLRDDVQSQLECDYPDPFELDRLLQNATLYGTSDGVNGGFEDPVISEASAFLARRGFQMRLLTKRSGIILLYRLGPGSLQEKYRGAVCPEIRLTAVIPGQLDQSLHVKEEGWCLLPDDFDGIWFHLLNEPGFVPMYLSRGKVQGNRGTGPTLFSITDRWQEETFVSDPSAVRVFFRRSQDGIPQFVRVELGGAVSWKPNGSSAEDWDAGHVQVRLSDARICGVTACPNAKEGCTWSGMRQQLSRHLRFCSQINAVLTATSRAYQERGDSYIWLAWHSGRFKTDLDLSVVHPCDNSAPIKNGAGRRCRLCSGSKDLDDVGHSNSDSYECVTWPAEAPLGKYSVSVDHKLGPRVAFQVIIKLGRHQHVVGVPAQSLQDSGSFLACSFEHTPNGIVPINQLGQENCNLGRLRQAASLVRLGVKVRGSISANDCVGVDDRNGDCGARADLVDGSWISADQRGFCHIGDFHPSQTLIIVPSRKGNLEGFSPLEVSCSKLSQPVQVDLQRA